LVIAKVPQTGLNVRDHQGLPPIEPINLAFRLSQFLRLLLDGGPQLRQFVVGPQNRIPPRVAEVRVKLPDSARPSGG